ncbi:MAG: AsmA family protein, partial [Bdellovibrionota bacterium]
MKKLLWIVGSILIVLIVAIVSVPLFVDVDQYRPTITAEANKRINGQLELGKLKLSLWGAIKIHAESIVVKVNGFNEPMLDTKSFHLEIPFMSVISGKPQIIAVLDAPKILVRKEANGKMNVLELMKVPGSASTTEATPVIPATEEAAVTDQVSNVSGAPKQKMVKEAKQVTAPQPVTAPVAVAPVTTAPAAPTAQAAPTKVPALVAGARIGLTIHKGEVHYVDVLGKSNYDVNGLDLEARNLGLGSTMDISLTAPVKGAMPNMTFEGPISLDAQILPVLANNEVKSVKGKMNADATKLAVEMKGGAFHKTASMPLTLKAELDGNESETLIRSFELRFNNYQIHGKGRATAEPVTAKVEITTEPLRLNEIQQFVPMATAYDLKGIANLNVKVDYSPAALRANGDLGVKDGSFFMKDVLKAPMEFQVQAGFSENTFSLVRASITAPDSDLQLVGDVKNFLAPQFNFSLTGKSFNVDKALVLPSASAPAKTALLSLISEAIADEPKG